ncbi:hypothetical protein EJ03DRAFT_330780 [Teratosphaeria nubilosa]|uniref:DNA excision repair protein n=1 Tax=Teratosphaeria nubilosa TaxID=161662 RepID=A0A6G1L051_9PEZI|nr:hypothetical protein EJ03DRAFT_330780 [Teratosphaeria nubilosa]
MSARKLGSDGHREKTLEGKVNRYAGEDSSSDDELDMIPQDGGHVDLSQYIDSLDDKVEDVLEVSSGVEGVGSDVGGKKRKLTYGKERGERVAFDDDEASDDAYQKFKKRKAVARKAAAASTRRAKAAVKKSTSLVGRKTINPVIESKRKSGDRVYGEEANSDEDLMETTLPDYLKERSDRRKEIQLELGHAGLQFPPDYEDIDFTDDERLEHLRERPQLPESMLQRKYEDVTLRQSQGIIPAPIAQYLRPYQIEGADYLHRLFLFQEGGILGDDMGLGKTIQVIAFLTAAFGKTGDERDKKRMRKVRLQDDKWYPRVLIIAPTSLLENWKNELDKWGWWHVQQYHGSARGREEVLAAAEAGRLEIMITTYDTYKRNESAVNLVRWDCVIADECHIIKERKTTVTKEMNKVNALCRIGMTGTAIQNKYEELWTLLNWTNPGKFGPISTWKQTICIPLKIGQSHDASNAQLSKARRTADKLVNNLLPRFFLRRTKALLKDQLPKKTDRVAFCPMTEVQTEAYNNFCDAEITHAIRDSSEPCWCGSGKKQGWCCRAEIEGFGKWQHFVFPALFTLRSLANHVALLLPSGEADTEKHDKDVQKLEMALPDAWKDLCQNRDKIQNFSNQQFCGKWRVLKQLLRFWHDNGDKVLVFSHSVKLLTMLKHLFTTTTSYSTSYLDGNIPMKERQTIVDDFNSNSSKFVFLISTKAGGVGLNITAANKVVVVDPNWNPAYDLQAQDRAYRIGQLRDVEVYRLVSKGTVEEIVYARQIYKQQQANIGYNASLERRYFKGVQDNKEMKGEIFGLQNLFAPASENVKLQDIVNKTNIAETRAGVDIAGLDFEPSQHDDDADDPDSFFDDKRESAAMSQLADFITGESESKRAKASKRKDPVSAILASVGVEYTHENAEVIGTSKIETKISSRAQKAGNDMDYDQDRAFVASASQTLTSHHVDNLESVYPELDSVDHGDGAGKLRYRYKPDVRVRKRQFGSMARWAGFEDVTEFALVVEGWTQGQRRECLERFYMHRREVMGV